MQLYQGHTHRLVGSDIDSVGIKYAPVFGYILCAVLISFRLSIRLMSWSKNIVDFPRNFIR